MLLDEQMNIVKIYYIYFKHKIINIIKSKGVLGLQDVKIYKGTEIKNRV